MSGPTDRRIRVAFSDPKLKDKLQINITGAADVVYWYIRFNIPLDPESVSEKSMEVTDTDGYIMRTDISYQPPHNRIVISPLDTYEQERYYILKVSRAVRSEKGQNLKTIISILFKLKNNEISEYNILRKDVPVPGSRPRPANYETIIKTRTPNYLDDYSKNRAKHANMIADSVGMNMWLGILGLVLVFVGFISENPVLVFVAAGICCLGAGHIYLQWRSRTFRSKAYYNRGVRLFNKMQYPEAARAFQKAYSLNPANDLAKYGISRTNRAPDAGTGDKK